MDTPAVAAEQLVDTPAVAAEQLVARPALVPQERPAPRALAPRALAALSRSQNRTRPTNARFGSPERAFSISLP